MAVKDEYIRGLLLDFLYNVYPDKAAQSSIRNGFYQYYTFKELDKALGYLIDSKYIDLIKISHPIYKRKSIISYKITKLGIDLIEGNVSLDKGITLIDKGDFKDE